MFGFRNPFSILIDFLPFVVIVFAIVGVVAFVKWIKKTNHSNEVAESTENQVEKENVYARCTAQLIDIRNKALTNTKSKFYSHIKNDDKYYPWSEYWVYVVDLKDKKLKKEEWVSKYSSVIEDKLKSLYEEGKNLYFDYDCDDDYDHEELADGNFSESYFDYHSVIRKEDYDSYEDWKNAFMLEYVVLTEFDRLHYATERSCGYKVDWYAAYNNSKAEYSSRSNSISSDLYKQEQKRLERQQRQLEKQKDWQMPSMEDMKYGAVRKDRYGNLYTAGGTIIDKAAIELKKQGKKK